MRGRHTIQIKLRGCLYDTVRVREDQSTVENSWDYGFLKDNTDQCDNRGGSSRKIGRLDPQGEVTMPELADPSTESTEEVTQLPYLNPLTTV